MKNQGQIARERIAKCGEKNIGINTGSNWLAEITILIKTFERPLCVAALILSIRKFYPDASILVCDDSREPLYPDGYRPISGVMWLTLPYENGHTLGAGRNYLISKAETPYVFLCDDDHKFVRRTDLKRFHDFLERTGYDIAGGCQGWYDYGAACFVVRDGVVEQQFHAYRELIEPRAVACDRVSNTFMARTASLRAVQWEPHVYGMEHADFFLRAKTKRLKVAQLGGVWVDHARGAELGDGFLNQVKAIFAHHPNSAYRKARMGAKRSEDEKTAKARALELYKKYVLDFHGITEIRDVYRLSWTVGLYRTIGFPFI